MNDEFTKFLELRRKYVTIFLDTFLENKEFVREDRIMGIVLPLYLAYLQNPKGFTWSEVFERIKNNLNVDSNDETKKHRLRTIVNRWIAKAEKADLISKEKSKKDKRINIYRYTKKSKILFSKLTEKIKDA